MQSAEPTHRRGDQGRHRRSERRNHDHSTRTAERPQERERPARKHEPRERGGTGCRRPRRSRPELPASSHADADGVGRMPPPGGSALAGTGWRLLGRFGLLRAQRYGKGSPRPCDEFIGFIEQAFRDFANTPSRSPCRACPRRRTDLILPRRRPELVAASAFM